MIKSVELTLPPEIGMDKERLQGFVQEKYHLHSPFHLRLLRRSIDARSKNIKVNLKAEIFIDELPPSRVSFEKKYDSVEGKSEIIIVGAGPAGLFAALRLIELGVKPIILERGKDVRSRRRDLAALNKSHVVNPNSNYCFGEGGAGTYSDGKLYTRAKKRGNIKRILEILVAHGAEENILVESHPHIGTNKLPKIVQNLRESILAAGGEIYFNTLVTDFIIENQEIKGVITANQDKITGKGVILATGHSARDIYYILAKNNIDFQAKPFALGVRVEHPQEIIDQIQYHCEVRNPYLPASSYALSQQVKWKGQQHGVFSFCMCPGGFIVPAATAEKEIVINGMSPSRRNSRYANSGIVVAIHPENWEEKFKNYDNLAALKFQEGIERKAWEMAGQTQAAPAQRLTDFVNQKTSNTLPKTSYQPGLVSVQMNDLLPDFIADSLRFAFKAFDRKMKGYLSNEAVLVGVESRTSAPIRIPRDRETFEHLQIKGLYPCGEGAGYAGGIVSAAMDGENCATKLVEKYFQQH